MVKQIRINDIKNIMKYFIINAFTDNLDSGNQAAVCLFEQPVNDELMQGIASEFGLSETAFIEKNNSGFGLRWFTPRVEVDLCGHATLASAHVLWEQGLVKPDLTINFDTLSGRLSVNKMNELLIMDFPREDAVETECPEEIKKGFKIAPVFTGKNRFDYIAEVQNEEIVRTLEPDFSILEKLDTRGVIITSASESADYDFVSRFFAPNAGIPEDPVTGSAHCCLAPYWSSRFNKPKLTGYQASERGGFVYVEQKEKRVLLGGKAVTFSSGKLMD